MESSSPRQSNSFLRWLLITYLLLACLAFFSALDESFVRLFFVLALISGWKTFTSWRGPKPKEAGKEFYGSGQAHQQKKYAYSPPKEDMGELIESALRKIKSWPIHLKIVRGIWAFMILVGAFIFFVIILSSSGTDPQIYLQAAKDFYDTDQYDSAYVNFRRVLAIDNENTDALFGYGNTLYTRGYPDSSIYYYDKVLGIDAEFNDAQYNKAWVFNQRKMHNESIEEAEILLENEPAYFAAYQLLGDCYYAQTKYDDALMNYEQAYNNQWRNLWVCQVMAYLYETKGDVSRAISLYQEALQFDESNAEILKRLGEIVPGEEGAKYRSRLAELSQ